MWEFPDTMVGDSCGRASCFERCTTFTEIPGKLKESEQGTCDHIWCPLSR